MRLRPWAGCLALLAAAGCGDDETNDPPTVALTSPADGAHVTAAVNVTADARDDERVDRVRFTLDGELLAVDLSAPWAVALPVGEWASGEPVTVEATAWDGDGLSATAAPVTVTIDPSLQTVPQLLALAPDGGTLNARWLGFPEATSYTLELSRGREFAATFFAQTLADTQFATGVPALGVVYARVRALTPGGPTRESRPRRHADAQPLGLSLPATGDQAGALVAMLAPDRMAVIGGPAPFAPGAASELVALDGEGGVLARVPLPAAAARWRDDERVFLAGDGLVAAHDLADGAESWRAAPSGWRPAALGAAGAADHVLAAGPGDDGALVVAAFARADGTEGPRLDLPAAADLAVTQVQGLDAASFVVAGDVAGGGVGLRAHAAADGAELWRARFGTADGLRLRAMARTADGLALAGDAREGGAWVASFAPSGRLRWLVRERAWADLLAVAPAPDGGVLVAGSTRAEDGRRQVAHGALTAAGAWSWQRQRASGEAARGGAIAFTDDGRVLTAGAALGAGGDWDLLIVRTDDRGQ